MFPQSFGATDGRTDKSRSPRTYEFDSTPEIVHRSLPRNYEFEPTPGVMGLEPTPAYRSLAVESAQIHPFENRGAFDMPLFSDGDDLGGLEMPGPLKSEHAAKQQKVSSDQQLSAKMLSFQLQAPLSLQTLPIWIEPHTSFVSKQDPNILFQRLQDLLQAETRVDITCSQEKAKIRGIITLDGSFSRFYVRLYSHANDTVVEFQRREGDSLLVNSLYRRVVVGLTTKFVSHQWGETAPPPVTAPPPPLVLDLPEEQPQPQQVVYTVQNLVTLASSQYEDQRKEAVTGLVAVSSQHAPAIVDDACAAALILVLYKLLVSNNLLEIVRGAAICLSAVLQAYAERVTNRGSAAQATPRKIKQPFTNELGRDLTSVMMDLLDSPALLEYLDTKRHISHSLQSLAKAHPAFVSMPKYRTLLNRYASSKDEVLRNNVARTLQLIQV